MCLKIKDVCKVLQEDNPGLQEALLDSMQQPIKILNDRFQAMKSKEQVGFATSMDEINKTLDLRRFLELSIETEKDRTSKTIKESVPFQNFIEAQCNMSDYVFQIKKCQNRKMPLLYSSSCVYDCKRLCFLPLPC